MTGYVDVSECPLGPVDPEMYAALAQDIGAGSCSRNLELKADNG
jgi:hypothetical protein